MAYCTQQASSYVGLRGRGTWPARISSAGQNRHGRLGEEDRSHQSLLSTWTPEKPVKELLRVKVSLVHTSEQHTSLKYEASSSVSLSLSLTRHYSARKCTLYVTFFFFCPVSYFFIFFLPYLTEAINFQVKPCEFSFKFS